MAQQVIDEPVGKLGGKCLSWVRRAKREEAQPDPSSKFIGLRMGKNSWPCSVVRR